LHGWRGFDHLERMNGQFCTICHQYWEFATKEAFPSLLQSWKQERILLTSVVSLIAFGLRVTCIKYSQKSCLNNSVYSFGEDLLLLCTGSFSVLVGNLQLMRVILQYPKLPKFFSSLNTERVVISALGFFFHGLVLQ